MGLIELSLFSAIHLCCSQIEVVDWYAVPGLRNINKAVRRFVMLLPHLLKTSGYGTQSVSRT
jgi:hypothetical protein